VLFTSVSPSIRPTEPRSLKTFSEEVMKWASPGYIAPCLA